MELEGAHRLSFDVQSLTSSWRHPLINIKQRVAPEVVSPSLSSLIIYIYIYISSVILNYYALNQFSQSGKEITKIIETIVERNPLEK